MNYLLSCQCGKSVEVNPGDAGRAIRCSCGKSVQVPTLRELHKLPPAEVTGPAAGRPAWSQQQGATFAAGLLLLLLGMGLLAYFGLQFRSLDTVRPTIDPANSERFFAPRTPVETLEDWQQLKDTPFVDRNVLEPRYLAHRRIAQRLFIFLAISIAVGVAGLGLCGWALVARPAPAQKKRPRKAEAATTR